MNMTETRAMLSKILEDAPMGVPILDLLAEAVHRKLEDARMEGYNNGLLEGRTYEQRHEPY